MDMPDATPERVSDERLHAIVSDYGCKCETCRCLRELIEQRRRDAAGEKT